MAIAVSALVNSIAVRSTFYSIAAVAGAAMLLFVIQGVSSMICCWAVLAYVKASDVRTYNYLGGAKKK